MIRQAFEELYPGEDFLFVPKLKYSGKFRDYNANVRLYKNILEFNLSRKWKTISEEIRIGLVQCLMVKILKKKAHTVNMDMYEIFMKKIHVAAPKDRIDPELKKSFDRVNEKYFFNLIEQTNLVWGSHSKRKLGSYEYGSDTITISRIFENKLDMLDYIMYHEMLHKKHKFTTKNARSFHHTRIFKDAEKKFENQEQVEKDIRKLIRSFSWKLF
jgi:hypothetical protein